MNRAINDIQTPLDRLVEDWAMGELNEAQTAQLWARAADEPALKARLERLRPSSDGDIERIADLARQRRDRSQKVVSIARARWWATGVSLALAAAVAAIVVVTKTSHDGALLVDGLTAASINRFEATQLIDLRVQAASLADAKQHPFVWRHDAERGWTLVDGVRPSIRRNDSNERTVQVRSVDLVGHRFEPVQVAVTVGTKPIQPSRLAQKWTVDVGLPHYTLARLDASTQRSGKGQPLRNDAHDRWSVVVSDAAAARLRLKLEPEILVESEIVALASAVTPEGRVHSLPPALVRVEGGVVALNAPMRDLPFDAPSLVLVVTMTPKHAAGPSREEILQVSQHRGFDARGPRRHLVVHLFR
ncbi:MAG: hypothetical protein AAFN74_17410 [Myxococcota bacterium]